jgi:large subunit ribosomal protein L3
MQGLIGKKLGMTQVYDDRGHHVPVTVIAAGPCLVVQRKTAQRDGYDAVQLGFGTQKESRLSKAEAGRFKKAGVGGGRAARIPGGGGRGGQGRRHGDRARFSRACPTWTSRA